MTRSVEILKSYSSSFDRSLEHFSYPFIRWAPVRKEAHLSPQPRLQRRRNLLSTKLFRRLRRRTKPLSLPRVIVSVLSCLKERLTSYPIHCSYSCRNHVLCCKYHRFRVASCYLLGRWIFGQQQVLERNHRGTCSRKHNLVPSMRGGQCRCARAYI